MLESLRLGSACLRFFQAGLFGNFGKAGGLNVGVGRGGVLVGLRLGVAHRTGSRHHVGFLQIAGGVLGQHFAITVLHIRVGSETLGL